MHILVIAELFPPDMGGGSTRAFNAVKGLVSFGHRVTVVAAFPHYPTGDIPRKYRRKLMCVEAVSGTRVIRVWIPPLASRGLARRLILFLSFCVSSLFALPFVGRVDAVWAANPNVFSVYCALVYGFFERCPIVQNVDDLWPEELYNLGILRSHALRRVAEFVSWLSYRASAAITPVSPAYVDVILNRYEVDSQKVYFVPAGVDLDNLTFKTENENVAGTFKVLYIGALSPAYDFDYVLRAARLLASESGIRFVIQGEGDLGGGLQVKVREMALENVDVVLKVVSRMEVAELLSSADALLLPLRSYDYTGISSKLYEYQAAGKPIICCSKGQPARYVSETKSGIVVDPGDFEGLAKAILHLFRSRKAAKCLGEAGRRFVEENMSLDRIGSKMISVFEQVVAN